MCFRVPIPRSAVTIAVAMLAVPQIKADDTVAAEVKALRQTVEQQGKQLEALSAQVARLSARADTAGNTPATAATAPTTPAPTAPDNAEFAVPAARAVPPHPPANVHIVVKGESLEKIAKSHGTTVPDLQKINRISDPKKLQIGQQIQLPAPTPKKEGQ